MSKTNSTVTQNRLHQLFEYDQEKGCFIRKINAGSSKVGDIAGCVNSIGYVQIYVDGKNYTGHRLAWLYVNNEWPDCDIDHIDGNRSNNAISNLRLASRSQNNQNVKSCRSDNKSGYLGVSFHKQMSKWCARIKIGTVYKHLGLFNTPEEASNAYIEAKRLKHEFCTI